MGNEVVSAFDGMDTPCKVRARAGKSDGKITDWQELNLLGIDPAKRK